jgi:hypothetical protein
MRRLFFVLVAILPTLVAAADLPDGVQTSASGIRHSLLVCGAITAIIDEDSKPTVAYPYNTRDGYLLPSGNLLLAVSRSRDFPGGASSS